MARTDFIVRARVSEWHRCGTFRRVVLYLDVTREKWLERGDRVEARVQLDKVVDLRVGRGRKEPDRGGA